MVIHPDDVEFFWRIHHLAFILALKFNLPLEQCEPKRRPLADGAMGLCYVEERRISIQLRRKDRATDGGAWWRNRLPDAEILDTVAHELAHLRVRGENAEHRAFTREILAEAIRNWNFAA